MQEKININILNRHYDKIKEMLGSFILIYNKDYDFILIDNEMKNLFIDKSISYAFAIIYDEYNVKNFDECFISKDINIKTYEIPANFRKKILVLINEIVEDYKSNDKTTIFQINPEKHSGRIDLLYKSILYIIKLYYQKESELQKKMPMPSSSILKKIHLNYDSIVNQAIQFSICYEGNPKDYIKCREIILEDALNYLKYEYRLEKHINKIVKEDVNNFLDAYINKKTDYYFSNDQEIHLVLKNTLKSIKTHVEEIYKDKDYKNSPSCAVIYNEYKKIFSNIQIKINNNNMRTKLIDVIRISNMNYILKHEGVYIYPFIYDLLIMRFLLLLKTALFNEHLQKSNILAKEINQTKYKFYEKDSNENYLFEELVRLAEELPQDYINTDYIDEKYIRTKFDEFSKYPTQLIVKHYSQILGVKYKTVAIVASRLIFSLGAFNSTYFYQKGNKKNTPLTIDSDYFRALSLNVI